jgi:competence protein ComEC
MQRLHAALADTGRAQPVDKQRRRGDLRLVPAALAVWACSVAGLWLEPAGLALLGAALSVSAGLCLTAVWRRRKHNGGPAPRSLLTTIALALLLAAAVAAHSAGASVHRHEGALAEAISAGAAAVVELEVSGEPRRLPMPGNSRASDRWAVTVSTRTVTANGKVIVVQAQLLAVGGEEWQNVRTGQGIRTTGKLKAPDEGRAEAGILSATSPPAVLGPPAPWEEGPGGLRELFRESSRSLPGDATGLLPGMVTGDTSELDEQLSASMKTVGMTHLTAVSGANCTLVLGALLLAARSVRLPRAAAAGMALGGLALFVLTVAPDASVLLVSMAGGRTGRGLSFLCLAVIGLLLAAPELGASYGFILSVLATLGIVTLGALIVEWTPHPVPRWAAAGLAVPLSAQLFCGPVIVLLQPQFSGYALVANVVAAPLVVPVTIVGTAALPVLPAALGPGTVLVQVAGVFSNCVAGIARFFAGLPGASLPWPEGVLGALTMGALSCLTALMMWLLLHPAAALNRLRAAHAMTIRIIPSFDRVAPRRALPAGTFGGGRSGLVLRRRRGSLRVCKPNPGRNPAWPQSKHDPAYRRQTRRRGGT